MKILSLNPGSSSLKFAIHSMEPEVSCLSRGSYQRLGTAEAVLNETGPSGEVTTTPVPGMELSEAISRSVSGETVEVVGCRVVHGGSSFWEPTLINGTVLDSIRALAPLAPLHNARDVEALEAAQRALPKAKVYAVFDTAFHRTIPTLAHTYAIPKELIHTHQIRRFGFHGISYQYVSKQLVARLGQQARRLVICHLGNGASVCAVLDGVSVDTSMGMTPLEGLVMGTRSGDLDPGLILFLQRELGMATTEVDDMLNKKSGLLGLSGLTGDVEELEEAISNSNEDAELALEVFAYRVAKYIGAYTVALGGLDAIAFTGGIGEHSAQVRARICRHLKFMGVTLNEARNRDTQRPPVSQIGSGEKLSVWVVRTDEERQIAEEVYRTING